MASEGERDIIILQGLRQSVGTKVLPGDIKVISTENFTKQRFFEVTVAVINMLASKSSKKNGEADEEKSIDTLDFPESKGEAFRICNKIARIISSDYGYREKIDFQTFLYPDVLTIRSLLSFLNEKATALEKDIGAAEEAALGAAKAQQTPKELLKNDIQIKLKELLKTPWVKKNIAETIQQPEKIRRRQDWRTPISTEPETIRVHSIDNNRRIWHTMTRISNTQKKERSILESFADEKGDSVNSNEEYDLPLNGISHILATSVFDYQSAHIEAAALEEHEWTSEANDKTRAEFRAAKAERILSDASQYLREALNNAKLVDDDEDDLNMMNDDAKSKILSSFANRRFFETKESDAAITTPTTEENPEEVEKRRADELAKIEGYIDKIRKAIADLKTKFETTKSSMKQLHDDFKTEHEKHKKIEDFYQTSRETHSLFQDKEANMKKMNEETSSKAKKMMRLAQMWEEKLSPLVEAYRQERLDMSRVKSTYRESQQSLKGIKEESRLLLREIKQKTEASKQLQITYDGMPKDKKREDYTTMIVDIVKNIEKQGEQISNILTESRDLKRDIVSINDKLTRTFRECEEKIYKATEEASAKKQADHYSKSLYKNVVRLRQLFTSIVDMVKDQGDAKDQTQHLTNQITQIESRNSALNAAQVKADLAAIREENEKLAEKLKKGKMIYQSLASSS
mmetsp:Transcript_3204/g.4731  ORF Transcript_3204/g.4731 Transcript_3204/m.4731 type:complete len:688 (-) Transcript_3204:10-2073(-)